MPNIFKIQQCHMRISSSGCYCISPVWYPSFHLYQYTLLKKILKLAWNKFTLLWLHFQKCKPHTPDSSHWVIVIVIVNSISTTSHYTTVQVPLVYTFLRCFVRVCSNIHTKYYHNPEQDKVVTEVQQMTFFSMLARAFERVLKEFEGISFITTNTQRITNQVVDN